MTRMKVRMDEVQYADVIADLNVQVDFSEPYSDSMWTLECAPMTQSASFVQITLPNEYKTWVERA